MSQLISLLKVQLESLVTQNRYRMLKTISSDQGSKITHEGKQFVNFSSNNYLGLANHPALMKASIDAIKNMEQVPGLRVW